MKLQHNFPIEADAEPEAETAEVVERHAKVAEIINRHLEAIHAEIAVLDPGVLNVDHAGDNAEIARQVLTALVGQLRGYAAGRKADDLRRPRLRLRRSTPRPPRWIPTC